MVPTRLDSSPPEQNTRNNTSEQQEASQFHQYIAELTLAIMEAKHYGNEAQLDNRGKDRPTGDAQGDRQRGHLGWNNGVSQTSQRPSQ